MISLDQLFAAARSYSGVRWHHQGRSRVGVDCIGMFICVAHDLGLSDADASGYGTTPDGSLSIGLRKHCILQPAGTQPEPGMVAEMRFDREPQHVGLIVPYHLGGLGLLHAMSRYPRKVVEHRLDDVWRSRIVALYKLPGVEYA